MTRRRAAHGGYLDAVAAGQLGPPDWLDQAACRAPGADPDAWFPDMEDRAAVAAAVKVCMSCPVRLSCLERSLTLRELRRGVWGGMTPRQRQALARELGRADVA